VAIVAAAGNVVIYIEVNGAWGLKEMRRVMNFGKSAIHRTTLMSSLRASAAPSARFTLLVSIMISIKSRGKDGQKREFMGTTERKRRELMGEEGRKRG
jgi:hypothetical protein